MKLNKTLIAVSFLALGGAMTSCDSEWLEILPNTEDTIEVYYTNDDKIQEALTAAYDPMHWFDYANNYCGLNIYPEVLSDQCYPGGGDANDMAQWKGVYNFNVSTTQVLTTNWENAYSGVKRCNDVIFYMDNYWVKDESHGWTQKKQDYYKSQVLALRVFFYNQLWHWWGNIPYYSENLSASNGYTGVQYSHDEVYQFLVEDLESIIAADNLEWKAKADEEGEWCKESIFEINYSSFQANRGWSWGGVCGGTVVPAMIGPRGYDGSDGIHNGNGWGFGTVRKSCYNSFENGDVRRDASIWAPEPGTYNPAYQDTGYFLGKYAPMDKNNKDATGDKTLNYNNNLRLYRYSEVLLNAAELVVRGGGAGDAQGWLDQVRSRAGLGSKPATLANILDERKFEFLGEGKRYWDILRSGLGETLLVPDNELDDPTMNRQQSYTANKKYLPFSQSTIDRSNGSITQNPYYN